MIGKYDEHKDQVTLKLDRAEAYHLWVVLSSVGGYGPIRKTVEEIQSLINTEILGENSGAVAFADQFKYPDRNSMYLYPHLEHHRLHDPLWWDNWAETAHEQFQKSCTVEVSLHELMRGG